MVGDWWLVMFKGQVDPKGILVKTDNRRQTTDDQKKEGLTKIGQKSDDQQGQAPPQVSGAGIQ
ncbi:MAG: hypothetical protein MJA84_14465 [Firmicutes bacterium]|nr:hypothetical protein [Bacillota bacterium]